jgi:hypothetical protein
MLGGESSTYKKSRYGAGASHGRMTKIWERSGAKTRSLLDRLGRSRRQEGKGGSTAAPVKYRGTAEIMGKDSKSN